MLFERESLWKNAANRIDRSTATWLCYFVPRFDENSSGAKATCVEAIEQRRYSAKRKGKKRRSAITRKGRQRFPRRNVPTNVFPVSTFGERATRSSPCFRSALSLSLSNASFPVEGEKGKTSAWIMNRDRVSRLGWLILSESPIDRRIVTY